MVGVDGFEGGGDLLAVLVGDEPHRCPDQVNGAGLDRGLRPGRLDRLGEPGEAVAADDQHVPDPAVAQLGADPGPELGPFGGLDPDPQHVFDPSRSTPTAMWAALLRTWWPSRTLTTRASR
jgi:hypothetical protein